MLRLDRQQAVLCKVSASVGPVPSPPLRPVPLLAGFLLAIPLLAAGCSSKSPDPQPEACASAPTQVAQPQRPADPKKPPLRPVVLPCGEQIAFLLPETRAQVLCQALTPDEWATALGSKPVRLQPDLKDDGGCRASTDQYEIILELTDRTHPSAKARDDIGGRAARQTTFAGSQFLEVRLTDKTGERGYAGHRLTPYLTVLGAADIDIQPRAEQVAQALVPKLTRPGAALPHKGEYASTALPAGIPVTDPDVPTISRILCTIGLSAAQRTPDNSILSYTGDGPYCSFRQQFSDGGIISDTDGRWNFGVTIGSYGKSPAGKPGELLPSPGRRGYQSCLSNACTTWLEISGEDAGAPVTMRDFAQKVVGQLLIP